MAQEQFSEEMQVFIEYLKRGTLLLDLQELDLFHFTINKLDPHCKELADIISQQGVTPENYEQTIRPKAVKLMETMFTQPKIDEIHGILKELETKYKDNEEITRIALASKLFLEDKNANHNYLPIAVARFLEDIYAVFYINAV